MKRKETWILHASALPMSDMDTLETYQTLMAIDDRTGQIVGNEVLEQQGPRGFTEAFMNMLREADRRPGSIMVTSPRLDDMFAAALKKIDIRYTPGRILRADDPRVSDVEDFFRSCQSELLEDMIESCPRGPSPLPL